jgi:hypothetical protein
LGIHLELVWFFQIKPFGLLPLEQRWHHRAPLCLNHRAMFSLAKAIPGSSSLTSLLLAAGLLLAELNSFLDQFMNFIWLLVDLLVIAAVLLQT